MNRDEYLDRVYQLLRQSFRPDDPSGSMTVATAAYLVKQHLGVDQTAFSFFKFKDVLAVLENRGLVRTESNSKQAFALRLLPTSEDGQQGSAGVCRATDDLDPQTVFKPLRQPIWLAFVVESSNRRKFFHRLTGELRNDVEQPTEGDWIEIFPIDPAEEKTEARRFIEQHQLGENTAVCASLDAERWYFEFPMILASVNPDLAVLWKRQRSRRVVAKVENWRTQHNVQAELVFEREFQKQVAFPKLQPPVQLRQALLSAISQMSTDRLLELTIPSKLLIAALRPDLLNS